MDQKRIDRDKPVLVTGANGYVSSWLVKRLVDEGMTVHAAVRTPDNEAKISHLKALERNGAGKIKFFKADLLSAGSYQSAMEQCEVVFHTASPFTINVTDPQTDLLAPAVNGTENVLLSANLSPYVKRVVLTSSCVALYADAIDCANAPGGQLTEQVWNTTASHKYQPYAYSKTLAEKKAWEIARDQSRWDLVTINPSLVMGPPLSSNETTSESLSILKQFGDGTLRFGVPRIGIGLVDVRDVAEAHFRAAFTPEANGRYITSAYNTDFFELVTSLRSKYGRKFPLPSKALPKWFVMIAGPLINRQLSRRFVRNNVDVPWRADNSKIRRDLGLTFRPMQETMEDSFEALIEAGVLLSK